MPPGHAHIAMRCVCWEKRLEIHVERVGGRPESATVGVGIGIHDVEGINTLLALTKAQQSEQVMDFWPRIQPSQIAVVNYCQPLVVFPQ